LIVPVESIQAPYQRKGIYSVDEVLCNIGNRLADYDGDLMNMNSARYAVFSKSLSCATCGIQGIYFAKERFILLRYRQPTLGWEPMHGKWHFNLYAVNEQGEEVLMTKDHIFPKSKGGRGGKTAEGYMSNYQTMCHPCNYAKGTSIPFILAESEQKIISNL
jgi:hypothetical protein